LIPSSIPAVGGLVAACIPTKHDRRVALPWMLAMDQFQVPLDYHIHVFADYNVATGRERLAEIALADGASYILWLDDDIYPPANGLDLALRHRYPIVSGCYVDREDRPAAVWLADWEGEVVANHCRLPGPGQRLACDAVGLGFCLMDTRILRALPRPWFVYEHRLSEDFYFFLQVKRRLRIPVLLDGDIALGHERTEQVGPDGGRMPLARVRA
jgi:hypothetical protein